MQSVISDEDLGRGITRISQILTTQQLRTSPVSVALAEDGAAAQRRDRLEKSPNRFLEAQTELHGFA
jgi:hypothetical protein